MLQERISADLAGRYVIERELAHGGMAVVYVGRDRKHDRRVAIKVLDPKLAAALEEERFHREIALLARLQHPHILALHDSGEAGGSLYYVMPFIEGGSLRARLQQEGPLPVDDALRIAIEVADALAYAHGRGIVHRDVKPDNILLSGYAPTDPARRGSWHAVVCDFGIARLTQSDPTTPGGVDSTTGSGHTVLGMALGTPTYMAPEQASGDRDVDGRADVWTLGMVLYEMLAGAVPFDDAPTPHAALVQRLTGPPPSIGARRRDLPRRVVRELDAVLTRAVQPDPAHRFQDAGEMSRALQACRDEAGRGAAHGWRAATGALTLAALGLLAWAGLREQLQGQSAVDPSLHVVLPFTEDGAHPDGLLDGRNTGLLLVDALSRWSDLRQVNTTRVNDAIARHGRPRTLAEARDLARSLRAGRLLWGSVGVRGGRTVVRAALYDVLDPSDSPREHRVDVRPALPDLEQKFGALADSLLLGTARAHQAVRGALSTTSWTAWRAYDQGHEALARWDLPKAEQAFAEAADLDPSYAHAHLWRAQALSWMVDVPPPLLRLAAERAVAQGPRLQPAELLTARAVHALAGGRYPEACTLYRQLVVRDSMDFAAWYGLGDCQTRDSSVVADAASPSGWRFRANYQAALDAYQRALSNLPSVHRAFGGSVVSYLPRLLVANGNQLRLGYAVRGRDTVTMAAHPSLTGDSLTFVPWPLADFAAVRPHTMPASTAAATTRNRQLLLEIAQGWAVAFPRSPEVMELLGIARESLGRLDGDDGALAAFRAVGGLTPAPDERTRVAVGEIRVLLKLGRFAEARARCERLLARAPVGAQDAAVHAVAAALTGRVAPAAALWRAAVGIGDERPGVQSIPPALLAAARAHEAFAALGAADSVLAARAQVERLLLTELPATRRDAARQALLPSALALAVPVLGARALRGVEPSGDYLLELAAGAARGDTADVRRRFATLAGARHTMRPSDLSLDAVYVEAWLHAWLGDSATAVATLDGSLESLREYGTFMIRDVPQAASLGRAMALRAQLARRAGDAERAARWSDALTALHGAGGGALAARTGEGR
jgi:tetratricopeptide (TPR) repeat protein/tRNA A-37 threonylcarbamoyl transferase component Bud32